MSPQLKASSSLDPRDSESPFGVLEFFAWNHDWNDSHYPLEKIEDSVSLLSEAHVGWVRMDFLWSDLEPTPGQFDFKRYDQILEKLAFRNIRVLGILHYNPDWRAVPWNTAPQPDDYLRYAMATVDHFKDRVRYWEIWNEPDQDIYWIPQDGMKAYSELIHKVTPALKKVDPTCLILLGGLSKNVPERLREVYQRAGAHTFDIVNLHPFVNPLDGDPLDQLTRLHEQVLGVMREFEDEEKAIWWTEVGCPGIKAGGVNRGWWLGHAPDENIQAEWVRALYQERARWRGVKKIFWAFFRDTPGHFKNDVDHLGLLRNDLTPKPAYFAYREVAGGD